MSGRKYTPCERFRVARGWSQVRLAGIAGCGTGLVNALEHDRYSGMRVETLMRVAAALGCAVVDLVPGLAVRVSVGGKVQESGGGKRVYGKARRELIRRGIVEVIRGRGGECLAEDVVMELVERYGVTRHMVVVERRGLEGVEAEQMRGVRPGLQAWVWRIRASAGDSPATAAGHGDPGSLH